jgi:hypothetical protein
MPRAPLNIEGPSPLAGLGGVLSDFGSKIDKARESFQLAKAQTTWKEGMADFGSSLEGDTDYETYEKRFDLFAKNLHKSVFSQISHKGASRVFEFWAKDSIVAEKTKVKHRANQLEVRFMGADHFKQLTLAVKREDRNFIIDETRNAIEAGYVDPIVGAKAQEAALEKLDWTTAWNDIVNVGDRGEAQAILDGTDLSLSKKNTLLSNWEREQSFKRARAKEAKGEAITKIQNDFVNRIDELTPNEVQQSGLDPVGSGSKMFFLNLIESKAKAIEMEKNDPYLTTDPVVLAQLMTRSADPDAVPLSASEILEYIPKEAGLSITDARTLINTTDIRKTDVFKNTEAALKVQFGYEGLLTGFGSKQLGAIYYNNAMSEILGSLAQEPLTGKALRDKIYEVAGPYLEQYMQEYGESQDQIDKKLRLMGVKTSPARKITVPEEEGEKKRMRWIPGKGWDK